MSVALAIQKVFPCKKVGEAVIGLEVPHAHIHLDSYSERVGYDFFLIRS